MYVIPSVMANEEDRLDRRKRVLQYSQLADRHYPLGRSTKRRSSSMFPDILESWEEVERNPWEGEGSNQYGYHHRDQFPLVRSYGAGRDSIVANYRLSESSRSKCREVLALQTTPQALSQHQSPAARSRSTYPSPLSSSPSPAVFNIKPNIVKNPVYSQPLSTVTSGEGGSGS